MKENKINLLTLLLIISIIAAAILLSGCATQKRCLLKFPPDTITYTETITLTKYKDSIIFVNIPGDSIFTHDTTYLFNESITIPPLRVFLPLAHSEAWVDAGRLNLGMWIDSTILQFKIDSAKATVNTTNTITKTIIVEKPVKEKWARVLVWVLSGAFLGLLIISLSLVRMIIKLK